MRKLRGLILGLFIIGSSLFAQEEILYNSSPTLEWNYGYTDANGDPLLDDDIVNFEVYLWDESNGSVEEQPIEALTPFTVTNNTEVVLSFPYRSTWSVAILARVTDGAGNTEYSDFAYSTIPEDSLNNPFVYAPNLQGSLPKPTDLRDSGI